MNLIILTPFVEALFFFRKVGVLNQMVKCDIVKVDVV